MIAESRFGGLVDLGVMPVADELDCRVDLARLSADLLVRSEYTQCESAVSGRRRISRPGVLGAAGGFLTPGGCKEFKLEMPRLTSHRSSPFKMRSILIRR
jgi:hypothetical protein